MAKTISSKAFMNANRELCVDVTTHLLGDKRLQVNKNYYGLLCRHEPSWENGWRDDQLEFTQMGKPRVHRNPHVFRGRYITVTQWRDGSFHPYFRPLPEWARQYPATFAFDVANELMTALSLVKENEQVA